MASEPQQKEPGKTVTAFYQEVKEGDIRKYEKKSNDSQTGGGARDLRISPVSTYWNNLAGFFPAVKNERERRGTLLSAVNDSIVSVDIVFMGPTKARKNECRICKIPLIRGWNISEEEYTSKINAGHKWFFLLILDDKGQVWADKFCSDQIDNMHDKFKSALAHRLRRTTRRAIRGIINF